MSRKPRRDAVRIIYQDAEQPITTDFCNTVVAVIGPFKCHRDKLELQHAIELLLIGYNYENTK